MCSTGYLPVIVGKAQAKRLFQSPETFPYGLLKKQLHR